MAGSGELQPSTASAVRSAQDTAGRPQKLAKHLLGKRDENKPAVQSKGKGRDAGPTEAAHRTRCAYSEKVKGKVFVPT